MARTRKKKSTSVPPWAMLLIGIVTGLFLAFLYYLATIKPDARQASAVASNPQAAPRKESKPASKYDFYTLLPDKEVVETAPQRPKPATPTSSKPEKPETFLIQTGSFRSAQDADRRRAELILMGLDVKVQPVELHPGETWHRVQIGPFDSPAKLEATKATLNENKVEYIVVRLK